MILFELLFVLESDPVRIRKKHLNLTSQYTLFEKGIKAHLRAV